MMLRYKGKRIGDAGVHKKQALVLVNYGNASGQEILALAKKIQAAVKESFNISLDWAAAKCNLKDSWSCTCLNSGG